MKPMAFCLLVFVSASLYAQDVYQKFLGKWKYSGGENETREFIFKKKNVVVFRTVVKTGALNKSVRDMEGNAYVDADKSILSIGYFDLSFKRVGYKYRYKLIDDKTIELTYLADTTASPFLIVKQ